MCESKCIRERLIHNRVHNRIIESTEQILLRYTKNPGQHAKRQIWVIL